MQNSVQQIIPEVVTIPQGFVFSLAIPPTPTTTSTTGIMTVTDSASMSSADFQTTSTGAPSPSVIEGNPTDPPNGVADSGHICSKIFVIVTVMIAFVGIM